ncbi:hypothetical protein YerA41_196c [Yersinia phage YerA41]|nr:hypothetical protein YerA41_196c [Yersinia phage YerA41]
MDKLPSPNMLKIKRDKKIVLSGVIIIGNIKVTKQGQKTFKFECPFTGKLLNSSYGYLKHLKSIGKTPTDLVLKINGLSYDDLPRCEICNNAPVRLGKSERVDILDPKLSPVCSSDCGFKYGSRNSHKTMGVGGKREAIKKANTKWTKEAKSLRSKNRFLSAIKNGNHSCQSSGTIEFSYNGRIYKFRSKSEYNVFIRLKRLLSKFYTREKSISTYNINGNNHLYIADYILNDTSLGLPDVIEVKGGNLFYDGFVRNNASSINYNKYLSVINLGLKLLIIDYNHSIHKFKFIRLNNKFDLDNLFNGACHG